MDALIFAFHFFTNLPLPGEADWNEKTAAASITWLPLTGLALGLVMASLRSLCQSLGFPQYPPLAVLLLLAAELWTGGTLLLDGFCDSCDGLFSRRDREQALLIMKDSRLGAMGALGLVFAFAAKLFLLTELSAQGDFLYILAFYPCWGRYAVNFGVYLFPAAKREGMAFFFKSAQKPAYFIAGSVFVCAVLLFMPFYFPLAALASLGLLIFFALRIQARLGGQTGDTYGMLNMAAELSFLFFAALCKTYIK
jgi:adenosylcobinamide-GDP ribazoletransferase